MFAAVMVLIVVLIALLLRHYYLLWKTHKPTRGTAPGRGETEIVSRWPGRRGTLKEHRYRVTKDPQAYAKLFVKGRGQK